MLAANDSVRFGAFLWDGLNRLLIRDGRETPLPPRALGVLECLLEHPGQVLSRQELLERVWRDAFVTDTSLAEAVSVLRQALGDDPQEPRYIQTIHRRGYRFVAPVEPVAHRPSDPPGPSSPGETAPAVLPSIGALVPWGLVLLLSATLAVALWRVTHPQEAAEAHVARFELTVPPELTLRTDTNHLAISPDGRLVAFSACADSDCRLYLRELADPAPRAVDGTSGASAPFFSPDGRALGYFADGKLKKAMLAGGAVSVLCDAPDALGATWLDDGRVVFASHELGGLEAVSENGGVPSPLTRVDVRAGELGHRQPRWLPGTDFVVFTATSSLADPDGGRIIALSLDNGRTRVVTGRARSARLIAPDILVHGRGTHLLAMRFDGVRGVPTTAPVALVGELRSADDGELLLAASASGTVLMVPGPPGTRAREVLAGLGHRAVARSLEPFREIALDPQGSRLAGIVPDGLKGDLWVGDASRGTVMRLTHDHPAAQPVWSVDGRRVIYSGAADGVFNLWMADAETSSTRRVTRSPLHQFATSVTGDGQIVYTQIDPASRGDIWMADSHGRVTALMKTAFDERGGAVSPDGRWLAYLSDESGRWQVYAKALHGATRFTVSRAGADRAWWLADGRLVYTTIGGQVDEVTIAADGRVEAGRTRTFAPAVIEAIAASGALLLSRDGSLRPRPVLTLNALREIARALPPGVTTLPR